MLSLSSASQHFTPEPMETGRGDDPTVLGKRKSESELRASRQFLPLHWLQEPLLWIFWDTHKHAGPFKFYVILWNDTILILALMQSCV